MPENYFWETFPDLEGWWAFWEKIPVKVKMAIIPLYDI
jgi:hypothetical protein